MKRVLVALVVAVLVAASGSLQDRPVVDGRDNEMKVARCLIDALPEAEINSPGLADVLAGIRGRRGVCLPDRSGRPRHVPIMACSVGWGMFKEEVYSSRAILSPPGTVISYALDVPEGGRIEFGMAAWDWSGDAAGSGEVVFEIAVGTRGSDTVTCFEETVPLMPELIGPGRKRSFFRRSSPHGESQRGPRGRRLVDLSCWAGQRVRVSLSTRMKQPGTGSPPASFWLSPALIGTGSHEVIETVIIAVIDSMKYDDFLSLAEDSRRTFGRLAEEGTLFTRAYANGTWTRTSTLSMLTSRDPLELALPLADYAVRWGAREFFYSLPVKSLPSRLRENGMQSAAFGDNIFISPTSELGLDAEFDEVHFFGRGGADGRTVDAALRWASARAGRPLFIYVHLSGAHRPRTPPISSYMKLLFRHPDLFFSDPSVFAALFHDQELLGKLLRGIESLGRGEGSLLILTSDHGRPENDPGRAGAKGILSEDMLRVPLLFRGGGARPGARVSRTVNLIDVMPSILDLTRVPGSGREKGLSLAPLMRGSGDISERDVYAVGASSKHRTALIRGGEVSVMDREMDHGPQAPKDYHIYIMEAFSPAKELRGEISCGGEGRIAWMLPVGFGEGDALIRLSERRMYFELHPGDPGRQVMFAVDPQSTACEFTLSSGDALLDPAEIGLGPASLRPLEIPFSTVGGDRSGPLFAPLYPAVLSDGTTVSIYAVPYQRWLTAGNRMGSLTGPLKNLLISWGYWREDR